MTLCISLFNVCLVLVLGERCEKHVDQQPCWPWFVSMMGWFLQRECGARSMTLGLVRLLAMTNEYIERDEGEGGPNTADLEVRMRSLSLRFALALMSSFLSFRNHRRRATNMSSEVSSGCSRRIVSDQGEVPSTCDLLWSGNR